MDVHRGATTSGSSLGHAVNHALGAAWGEVLGYDDGGDGENGEERESHFYGQVDEINSD